MAESAAPDPDVWPPLVPGRVPPVLLDTVAPLPGDPRGRPAEPPSAVLDARGALVVTPAGGSSIATDGMLAAEDRLERLRAELQDGAGRLAALLALPVASGSPEVRRSTRSASLALEALRRAARCTTELSADLAAAGVAYSRAAGEQDARSRALGEGVGRVLGGLLARIPPGLVLSALLGGLGVAAARALGIDALGPVRQLLIDNPRLLTDPAFVEGVRMTATSIDDGVEGFLHLPAGSLDGTVERVGGDVGFGALHTMALGGTVGLLRESGITSRRVSEHVGGAPARGAAERFARVRDTPQVRIEHYTAPGLPNRFLIYVGPTDTFSPAATREPWDMASNVGGVAGGPAASIRATELAMRDAGVLPGDEVALVGYSQGGMVAARVAASGEWNAVALETYAAPIGNIDLPEGLRGMAVQHTDDLVPALAGPSTSDALLQVERRAFPPGVEPPPGLAVPGHQPSTYQQTAEAIDTAQSSAIRDEVAAMDAFSGDYLARDGATVTELTYRADRIPVEQAAREAGICIAPISGATSR